MLSDVTPTNFKATMYPIYIVVLYVAVKNAFMTNTSATTTNRS